MTTEEARDVRVDLREFVESGRAFNARRDGWIFAAIIDLIDALGDAEAGQRSAWRAWDLEHRWHMEAAAEAEPAKDEVLDRIEECLRVFKDQPGWCAETRLFYDQIEYHVSTFRPAAPSGEADRG